MPQVCGRFRKVTAYIKLMYGNNVVKSIHYCNQLSAKVCFNLTDIGEGIREVVVKEWYVKEGEKVSQFDNICEVQSDKASVTITSRYDGIITKLYHKIDDIALVGKPLVDIETDSVEDVAKSEEVTRNEGNEDDNISIKDFNRMEIGSLCIPSVRRLAKQYKINLINIKGSGKNGRILKEDILKYIEQPAAKCFTHSIVPMEGFQKTMFKTMTESLKIPHVVLGDEIRVTKLSAIRNELKAKQNRPTSFLPFFVKAISNALHKYPILNSSLDENGKNIVYHPNHHVGIAMDTKAGLAVPIIKHVERLSVPEITNELQRLIKSGKGGNFSPSDLSGGTFSVSNIGSIGGTYAQPVILPPQVAIIALGASQVLPRFDEAGNIRAEEIIYISTSADHRVVDGATMANFVNMVKNQIENPLLLLLNIQ